MMHVEIKGRIQKINEILNGKNFYFADPRMERMITELRDGMQFLSEKVHALEAKPRDPHGYFPGIDDLDPALQAPAP